MRAVLGQGNGRCAPAGARASTSSRRPGRRRLTGPLLPGRRDDVCQVGERGHPNACDGVRHPDMSLAWRLALANRGDASRGLEVLPTALRRAPERRRRAARDGGGEAAAASAAAAVARWPRQLDTWSWHSRACKLRRPHTGSLSLSFCLSRAAALRFLSTCTPHLARSPVSHARPVRCRPLRTGACGRGPAGPSQAWS